MDFKKKPMQQIIFLTPPPKKLQSTSLEKIRSLWRTETELGSRGQLIEDLLSLLTSAD